MDRGGPKCPQCGRADTTWGVREFFAFARHYTSAEYRPPVGMGDVPCVRPAVPLARKLAPPPHPPRAKYGGLVGSLIAGAFSSIFLGFLLAFAITWVLRLLGLLPENAFWAIYGPAAFTAFVGVAAWLYLAERRADRQLPIWQDAFDRWQRLYYCCHCDGVFVPGQKQTLTPEQTKAYLTTAPPAA